MKTFTVYTDPGHAWAKVPYALLFMLGITDKITHFSYRKGAYAYLEEDLDMETFARAYRAQFGYAPQWVGKHANKSSKIRSYPYYSVAGEGQRF
jgi:hypothetical protein